MKYFYIFTNAIFNRNSKWKWQHNLFIIIWKRRKSNIFSLQHTHTQVRRGDKMNEIVFMTIYIDTYSHYKYSENNIWIMSIKSAIRRRIYRNRSVWKVITYRTAHAHTQSSMRINIRPQCRIDLWQNIVSHREHFNRILCLFAVFICENIYSFSILTVLWRFNSCWHKTEKKVANNNNNLIILINRSIQT